MSVWFQQVVRLLHYVPTPSEATRVNAQLDIFLPIMSAMVYLIY